MLAAGAHGADLGSSEYYIAKGTVTESNPILLRFKQPAVFGTVKMITAGLEEWAIAKLHETHRQWAIFLNYLTTAGFSYIAYHNSQIGK